MHKGGGQPSKDFMGAILQGGDHAHKCVTFWLTIVFACFPSRKTKHKTDQRDAQSSLARDDAAATPYRVPACVHNVVLPRTHGAAHLL